MPKRIYALAKELSIDSKELVDLCTRLGILNKGSALASLEDDELARIQSSDIVLPLADGRNDIV